MYMALLHVGKIITLYAFGFPANCCLYYCTMFYDRYFIPAFSLYGLCHPELHRIADSGSPLPLALQFVHGVPAQMNASNMHRLCTDSCGD